MAQVDLVDCRELDYEAFAALQRVAFAELLTRLKTAGDFMTPEFYRWKFQTAAGSARVVTVSERGELVAGNGMFPVRVRLGQRSVLAWQSCDSATTPAGRGKGYFSLCLETLKGSLARDEIFYGFPNGSSMRGCVKVGWREKCVVTTWVNPAALWTWPASREIERVDRLGEENEALAEALASCGESHISRDVAYLDWRYVRHPLCEYSMFQLRRAGRVRGFCVVRQARVMERDVTLVMELWGLERSTERSLLRHVARWTRARGRRPIVLMDSRLSLLDGLGAALLPVAARVLPKRQVLMGQAMPGEAAAAVMAAPWRVQTGDWDVF